ncbi:hypothetical protein [Staphylococcus americanisciuri]|uniref:Phage protein n=1 Tax=Staphylococcus americanisciuri TaxID=2973940 RepID=A0ABT2F1T6_9STAP|nr:hypothetical protein [Staphylococcus americanisciuri]MCS4486396.1 hypothetical protein [Staphylococcus americanisciuri]
MKIQFTSSILEEMKAKNITEEQLLNRLYIGVYEVDGLEFAVNKNKESIIIDSIDNFDLFGEDIAKTIDVDDFEV